MLGRHKWAPRHVVGRVNCRKCLRHATSVCVATQSTEALTCYNAPLCGSNCCRCCCEIYARRQATHRLWLCILPHRCHSLCVCVCVCVCMPQTRRWTRVCVNAQTYNNCSGYKEIQPHLASFICRIASKFEIKCLLCCQSSLPQCGT